MNATAAPQSKRRKAKARPAVPDDDAFIRALAAAADEMGDPALIAWVQSLAEGDRREVVAGAGLRGRPVNSTCDR